MAKFTIEDHEKKMRELLNRKPTEGGVPVVIQSLLDKAKNRRRRPGEGVQPV